MNQMHLLPAELADRWRMSVGHLANWRTSGYGPRYIKFGRKVLYPVVEIEAFEQQRLLTATSVRPGSFPDA